MPDAEVDGELGPAKLKRRSVHGAAVSSLGQVVRFSFQFGTQIYLAHELSPAAFGLVAMVAPLLRFVQLFSDMGLLQAVIQRSTISHRELSALFWINLCTSTVLALMLIAASPLAGWLYGEPRIPGIMASLAVILILSGLAAQPMALMNRRMQFVPLAAIDVISTIIGAAAGIAAANWGAGYWALVAMQAGNSIAICALAWAFAGWRPTRPRREPGLRSLLGFGGNLTAYNVVAFFSESLDNILLGATTGSAPLGLYDRSSKIVMAPMVQIMVPFTRVSVPLLCRLEASTEKYRKAYLHLLQIALLVITPGLVCAAVLADQVIIVLLGPTWAAAAPIARWLGIGALVHPVLNSASWLFVSQNRAQQQLLWGSMGFVIIVISFLLGLPWGPLGVARSYSLCTWLLQVPLIVWAATRAGPVRLRDVASACSTAAIGAAAAAVALVLARNHLESAKIEGLIFAILLSYAVHGVVLTLVPGGRRFLRDSWSLRSAFVNPRT